MASIEWETPQAFFDTLNTEFGFTVDACATAENAKCDRFWTRQDDALDKDWSSDVVWLNPPYNKELPKWIRKAFREAKKGAMVVCLVQGRSTDTEMFHRWVMKASEWRFVRDRLRFVKNGVASRSNAPSLIVIFRPYYQNALKVSSIDTQGNVIVAPP